MPIQPLQPSDLRRNCTQNHFEFSSTNELETISTIIGQPRGIQAIEFGISIPNQGYNIFIMGDSGTGRTTAITRFLEKKSATQPVPKDWVYLHNFSISHQPQAISFPSGEGKLFKKNVAQLIKSLSEEIPQTLASDSFQQKLDGLERKFEEQKSALFDIVQKEAADLSLQIVRQNNNTLNIVPAQNGQILTVEQLRAFPEEVQQEIKANTEQVRQQLDEAVNSSYKLETEFHNELELIHKKTVNKLITKYFINIKKKYVGHKKLNRYLNEMQKDIHKHFVDFLPPNERAEQNAPPPDLRRYKVNLIVDNRKTEGAPVIVETNPTYYNLIGRIEHELLYGAMSTHFTNIKSGSLHKANGGYLVMNARDVLSHPAAWEALKRTITTQKIDLQMLMNESGQAVTKSLDPEPIPLSTKIILLGSPAIYYALYDNDEEFGELFKVKADFDSAMPRNHDHEDEYALFIANRCDEEELLHFDPTAVARIVEFGARLSGNQNKLTARFGVLADLIRESSYWATLEKESLVTEKSVERALQEREARANRIQESHLEQINKQSMLISIDGFTIGQINGLSVIDMGDFAFGVPTRLTARTFMGATGVINIEREVNMAGAIHNKGLLTISGYLGGEYAQEQPLSLSASIAFEQQYGPIDGDSASSTELYALLSSISQIPLNQGIAVTGSVNQYGEIQPIGGVNEKIEGFFHICQQKGLTGTQGVIFPWSNRENLMLSQSVIDAVANKQFHIWAIRSIDEGLEILTGKHPGKKGKNGRFARGSLHAKVQTKLLHWANQLKAFNRQTSN